MEDFPIHDMQHGFMKGKSPESAISNTVDYIEQFLYEKQHWLGVFLDISSAFDSISIDHIRDKLLEHGGVVPLLPRAGLPGSGTAWGNLQAHNRYRLPTRMCVLGKILAHCF